MAIGAIVSVTITVIVKGKTVIVNGSVRYGDGVTVLPGKAVGGGVREATLGTHSNSPT